MPFVIRNIAHQRRPSPTRLRCYLCHRLPPALTTPARTRRPCPSTHCTSHAHHSTVEYMPLFSSVCPAAPRCHRVDRHPHGLDDANEPNLVSRWDAASYLPVFRSSFMGRTVRDAPCRCNIAGALHAPRPTLRNSPVPSNAEDAFRAIPTKR